MALVPPVDDDFDRVCAARYDPYQSGVVLAHLVDDLPESLLVDHVVVLGHLFGRILHHKVVHIDPSWLIGRRLDISRAEVLPCIPMWCFLGRWLRRHVDICSCSRLFLRFLWRLLLLLDDSRSPLGWSLPILSILLLLHRGSSHLRTLLDLGYLWLLSHLLRLRWYCINVFVKVHIIK